MRTARREFLLAGLAPWLFARTGAVGADQPLGDRAGAIEQAVFSLTNRQRTSRRLPPLDPSDELAAIARGHSRDMLMRAYFDHVTPEGTRSADRIAERGLRFKLTGENIYMVKGGPADAAELAAGVVRDWMSSEKHRENILAPGYRFLGVGVAATSRIVLATQLFAG